MYNEERKLNFISAISVSPAKEKWHKSLFERSERTEKLAGRDLCELYSSSLRQVLFDLGGIRENTFHTVYHTLLRYIRWCKEQGYPTTDDIYQCEPDLVSKVRTHMVASPAHLATTLDYVFPDPQDIQVRHIFRAFFWLGFAGMTDEEAIRVTANDLDFRRLRIHFEDHDPSRHPLSSRSVEDLRMAAELTEFKDLMWVAGETSYILRKRLSGDSILRGRIPKGHIVSDDPLKTFLRPSVSRAFSSARKRYEHDQEQYAEHTYKPALDLTFSNAFLSGLFHRAWKLERKHQPYTLPPGRSKDYFNWKTAFAYDTRMKDLEDG